MRMNAVNECWLVEDANRSAGTQRCCERMLEVGRCGDEAETKRREDAYDSRDRWEKGEAGATVIRLAPAVMRLAKQELAWRALQQ